MMEKEEAIMAPLGHWLLTAACGILGIVDITMFTKMPKEARTKLHWMLLVW